MATFGPTLRRTREARGISLDEIASETRLSKRYLLALEDEAIGKLPGGTYNRAYLRTYAAYLGLDPEGLLREYTQEEARLRDTAEFDQLAAMNRAIEKRGDLTVSHGRAAADVRVKLAAIAAAGLVAAGTIGGVAWFGVSGFRQAASTLEVDRGEAAPPTAEPAAHTAASLATAAGAGADARPSAPDLGADPPPAAVADVPVADAAAAGRPGADAKAADANAAGVHGPAAVPPAPAEAAAPAPALADAAAPAAPAAPESEPTVTAASADAADALSRLTVADSGVGTGIVDRQLVGQSDRFAVGSKVVFWTHVRGGRAGDTIDHVWFRDGVLVGAASLTVGSPDWRTQSRRLIDPSGVWTVEARDAEGHVLIRHQFRADDEAGGH